MTRFATEDTGRGFVMGMVCGAALGAAVGAAAGLLLAPEAGAALRQRLGTSAGRLRRTVGDEYTRAADAVTSAVDDVIERGARCRATRSGDLPEHTPVGPWYDAAGQRPAFGRARVTPDRDIGASAFAGRYLQNRAVLKRWLKWGLLSGAITGVAFLAVALWLLRPAHVKSLAESGLSEHLNLDASIEAIEVDLFPRPRISGTGLSLRIPDRPDLPPFIYIDHFSVNVGPLSIMRRHVDTVHAGGLRIAVPPAGSRTALRRQPGGEMRDVVIDHFVTHDAELLFVPRVAGRRALTFAIHDLDVHDVGFGLAMPFTATLTNPVPRGRVTARGAIGPILAASVEATPVSGEYRFEHADLSTINGIGGTLESTGRFSGPLTAITASGNATVPDFSLDLGGKPATLTAQFEALVNGTNGTTQLTRVDAVLLGTKMVVTGAISNLDGPGRRDVDLTVDISDGRIEDVLALVLDTPSPVMTGDVTVKARLRLPPGPSRVRERLDIIGEFGLTETRFTDAQVRTKLDELSRRSLGKDQE